jgi:hypothetical protein
MVLLGLEDNEAVGSCVGILYAPVICLGEYAPFNAAFERYVEWWMDIGGRFR